MVLNISLLENFRVCGVVNNTPLNEKWTFGKFNMSSCYIIRHKVLMSLQLNSVHLTWCTMRVAPHAWTHAHTWIQVRCVKTTRWMAASVLQVGDVQAFKAFKFRAPSWLPLDSTTCECLCGQQGPCLMIFPQRDASLSPSASANTTKSTTLARFTDRTPRSGTSKVPFFFRLLPLIWI